MASLTGYGKWIYQVNHKWDWEGDCLHVNLSVKKSSLPQGLNIESLTGVKLNAFSDTCLRHLFLTDPRSFYNFWNIQGSLQSASQTSEGFLGKATKDTRCYYLPTLFRNINNSTSKEGRWFGVVKYQKIHSQHLHVFCWSMLEMFPSGQHCLSNVALWEQGFLVKGPLQTSDTWNILIFCQSDTNLIFF